MIYRGGVYGSEKSKSFFSGSDFFFLTWFSMSELFAHEVNTLFFSIRFNVRVELSIPNFVCMYVSRLKKERLIEGIENLDCILSWTCRFSLVTT